jgi:hypothetical protein
MSKFGSKEEIIKAIGNQFELMESGKLEISDLESLVDQARELYERVLIIRHKAYEEKVFGESKTSIEKIEVIEVQKFEQLELEPEVEETEEKITSIADILNSNSDLFAIEEKPFDFDVFNGTPGTNVAEIVSEELELEEEIKEEPSFEEESILSVDLVNESSKNYNEFNKIEVEEVINKLSEEAFEHEQNLMDDEIDSEHDEEIDQEIEVESFNSEFFPNETQEVEEEENMIFSDISSETIENKPVYEERTIGNSIFDKILKQDDYLGSRLILSKLDTLIGAFGFNEKFQCIQELFKSSSEDFNQAIMILDNLQNFNEAKNQLEYYVHLYNWNLESEIVGEFIRKVERRFK